MFCIIYRFKVKAGKKTQFIEAWSEVTVAYKESCGALGSRLHKSDSGEYIAYAQWPSREVRETANLPESVTKGPVVMMRECCESIETLFELIPIADYLVHVDAIEP